MNAYTCSSALHLDRAARQPEPTGVEAIITITHEDDTVSYHPVYVDMYEGTSLDHAYADDSYGALDEERLEEARKTMADEEIDYWYDMEDEWAGTNPFAA